MKMGFVLLQGMAQGTVYGATPVWEAGRNFFLEDADVLLS